MSKAKIFFVLSSAMALSACLSSGGGGGGGSGGGGGGSPDPDPTPEDFATRFDSAIGLGPTTNLPVSGRGNYEGQVEVNVQGEALSQTNDVRVVGDVMLEIDFAAGNASALDGLANNFVGTLDDGSSAPLAGSLLLTPGTSQLQRADLPPPVSGSSGTLSAFYEGQLDFDGTTADVDLTMMGPALGSGAQAFAGAANASVDFAPGEGTDFIAAGGRFYLERQ